MPFYRVWYRNNPEPFEFSSAGICREEAIVDRILAHENAASSHVQDVSPVEKVAPRRTLKELIEQNSLAPIRYTEDESEPQTIA